DYASGTNNPNGGVTNHTFNELFPFNHYYLGSMDLVGRQNIEDINCHLFLYPTNWITLWGQYHHFTLASARDALYNSAGAVEVVDSTGKSGRNVGDEVHLLANIHMTNHQDFMVGYAKLFAGDFLKSADHGDSSLFYAMYTFRW